MKLHLLKEGTKWIWQYMTDRSWTINKIDFENNRVEILYKSNYSNIVDSHPIKELYIDCLKAHHDWKWLRAK